MMAKVLLSVATIILDTFQKGCSGIVPVVYGIIWQKLSKKSEHPIYSGKENKAHFLRKTRKLEFQSFLLNDKRIYINV